MTEWGHHRQVEIGIGTIDLRTAGPEDGEPIILLHGFPQTSLSWSGVAPALADAGFRVIAPDQRGYSRGARPGAVEDYRTDALADDVLEIADALGVDGFHLVGHDWGSSVAWVVAARHSPRLRSLTAVSVPHLAAFGAALESSSDQQQRSAYIGLFRRPGKAEEVLLADGAERLAAMYQGRVPADDVRAYRSLFSEPGALTAALDWYRAMRSDLSALPAVTVPTTFVWSNADMAIGREAAEGCAGLVDADYRFVELDDVTHWIPDQAPDDLTTAILHRTGSTPA